MRVLNRILCLTLVTIIVSILLLANTNNLYTSAKIISQSQINVAVQISSLAESYCYLLRENLEKIQNTDGSNIKYTFYDSKEDPSIRNEQIDSMLKDNYDLLLINSLGLNADTITSIINKVKAYNIPIIFFSRFPFAIEPIKSYSKAIAITSNPIQSGISQGKLVVSAWNSKKKTIDKNNNNILEYFMLKGPSNDPIATARTLYSILAINNAGIQTKELASIDANWDKNSARVAIDSLFLKYGNSIEAIISNNTAMAIGAIEALQKYGYNKGDSTRYISVFGNDGTPEVIDLINKGFMTGTVFCDPDVLAQALYTIGMNLANNIPPLENTNYKFNETGVAIEIPYTQYTK